MSSIFGLLRKFRRSRDSRRPSSIKALIDSKALSVAPCTSWKPVTLRAPLLCSLAVFTACFIILLEYLSRVSHQHGGIAFAVDDFSASTTFSFLYLPTMIATSYSIVWSWVDLDTKRLEPYFQMSRAEGAQAKDSLLLHYPFEFVAFVPYRALKRGHWSVFFAGASMMTIFWAITPLTSSIFATARVTRITNTITSTTGSMLPLESQFSALTTGFLVNAYGILWLEQAMPSFVTYDGALLPFAMESEDGPLKPSANWTTTTTMYKTSLACQPATVVNSTVGVSYSNGHGCIAELGIPVTTDPTALYIGWYMNQHIDYALSQMGCSSDEFSHLFLAYFSIGNDSTALFCEPTYWTQKVNATVGALGTTALPLGTPEQLTDTSFNISNFEYLLGTGAAIRSQRADISETSELVFQGTHLQDMHITGNYTDGNMVGYAFGITGLAPAEYLNSGTLASSFEKAHRLLFSLAFSSLLTATPQDANQRHASIQSSANTIFIVRILAVVVESFLGLVAIMTIALLYVSRTRSSQLRHDPASLALIMGMINPNSSAPMTVNDTTAATFEKSRSSVKQGSFHFHAVQSANEHRIPGSKCNGGLIEPPMIRISSTKMPSDRPLELRLTVAAVFITILFLAVIVLIVFYIKVHDNVGMHQPSEKKVINQLLTNYLPVVFATFLEPFWLLLNRSLCILRPFEQLRIGNAGPSNSLNLKYTSLPPQLIMFRALRARHILLAAICAVGLSANVLSVALGGLFQNKVVTFGAKSTYRPLLTPFFEQIREFEVNDLAVMDAFYIAKTNISDGTALPQWLSQEKFLLPFDHNDPQIDPSTTSLNTLTQGFGAKLTCATIEYDALPFITGSGESGINYHAAPVAVPQELTGGQDVICNNSNQRPSGGQNGSEAALEVIVPLSSTDSSTAEVCATLLLVGFLRANLTVSDDDFKTDNPDRPTIMQPNILALNSFSSLWMVCQPALLTASYSVTVDPSGRIQQYAQAGPYAANPDSFFSKNATVNSLFNRTGYIWSNVQDTGSYWHNDTFVDTWFAYFIKHLTNSTLFIDPKAPVPEFNAVSPVVEDILARIFAITLSLNTDWFANPHPNTTIDGTTFTTQSRIFLSRPAYIIVMTLLALNVVMAIMFYAKRPKKMLKRMPTTIASVLELFDGSGLIKETKNNGELKAEWKLGYGRFVGTDGKPRLGIERRPFVIPWGDGP